MSEAATTARAADVSGSTRSLWRVLRSVGALVAGVLVNIVVVGAVDAGLGGGGVYPAMFQPMSEGQWGIALATRLVFAIVGGWVTARLAAVSPVRHALVLGVIETALSVPFVLVNWNKAEFGPHWFGVGVAVSCLPLAALGGVLGGRRVVRVNQ